MWEYILSPYIDIDVIVKMHEDQFSKMESLDTYLDKKKKRTEATQEQFKKARTLAEEHTKIVERMKAGVISVESKNIK